MKNITFLFLIISTISFSQCKIFYDKVDDFTGKRTLGTKPERIATMDLGFYLRLDLNKNGDFIFIGATGYDKLGCATSDSYISIKLMDGNIITSNNFGEIDCSERPSMYFNLNDNQISLLKNSSIDKIRISGSELTLDSRNVKNPNYFIETLKCLED
tara:strand:+ start:1020 stop:1490 length:471 start_codon:yes stop_codon:yes gene_type:complete